MVRSFKFVAFIWLDENKCNRNRRQVLLELKVNSQPKYMLARRTSFALKRKIKEKLKRLVANSITEPVEKSQLAISIVLVLNLSGDVRIRVDFKVTVNTHLVMVRHPAPNFDHAILSVQCSKRYSKINLKEAYSLMLQCKNFWNY